MQPIGLRIINFIVVNVVNTYSYSKNRAYSILQNLVEKPYDLFDYVKKNMEARWQQALSLLGLFFKKFFSEIFKKTRKEKKMPRAKK